MKAEIQEKSPCAIAAGYIFSEKGDFSPLIQVFSEMCSPQFWHKPKLIIIMRRALVTGINEYPGNPLYGCVADATRMAELLDRHEDGSANFHVSLQRNVRERGRLRAMIAELFSGEGQLALFYFSGHGMINDRGGILVTPDFGPNDEGITMDEILNHANNSSFHNKVILLDCCHSGAMGTPAIIGDGLTMLKNGVTILTASRHFEPAMEAEGHGIFTKLLAEALEGGAADLSGRITPGSIYSYIDKALGWWGQRPVFKTNISSFISLRNVAPPVPLSELHSIGVHFPSPDSLFKLDPSFEHTSETADLKNVRIFQQLQSLFRAGLLEPVAEEYMYWTAMRSGSCRLTRLGRYYWKLIEDKRI